MKRFILIVGAIILIVSGILAIIPDRQSFIGKEKAVVQIGRARFSVDIADTPEERTVGLSGRPELFPGTGMLFVFSGPGKYGFWMRDMLFPIDIIWIEGGKIVDIDKNALPEGPRPEIVYYPDIPVTHVLEVPAGTADKLGITTGDVVEFK